MFCFFVHAAERLAHLRPRRFDLAGKNALISGGSRGLGLEIARVLRARGANVALVARDTDELDRALTELCLASTNDSPRVIGQVCDLCEPESISQMLDGVRESLGPIDVLVNNAGNIQVGPLDAMTLKDFEDAMKLHFAAPLRTALWLRDDMRQRGGGRIANVASIGGIVSVPHLLPYSASKFAMMGLSQGLRTELARENIFVSTIAPGLMRTGSPRRALFKGDHEKEYAWFKISDSLPFLSVSSERAAERIVKAIELGEPHVVIGLPAKAAALAAAVAPGTLSRVLTLANAIMPSGPDPDARQGFESESGVTRSAVTELTDRAAVRNNEM
ncbi:MAG TPA: SDR family NAD(P)-dependent oxidoreductase [Polyangiales bacterium]|nr:SDR family NAD(P)-dependent oxidoreductase [Polyangiales bacterium]